ncbi:MAG: toll/interleukin-1 receptor domain-containing protein [Pseudomonadota bacterium]
MADIFVCYRRADSRGDAGRLADSLDSRFKKSQVFRDVESLEGGVDYTAVIEQTIARCTVLLVVIGPRWLDIRNDAGERRLDEADDFIRLEIGAAIDSGVEVIPVLVGGAPMPRREELPHSLQAMAGFQAMELSDSRWDYDVGLIIKRVSDLVDPCNAICEILGSLIPTKAWLRWPAVLVATILLLAGFTQVAAVNDDPVLGDHLRLMDVDLESAPWADGNCLYPNDCDRRDSRKISSTIRVEGAEVRRDPDGSELHVVLSLRWVLRDKGTNILHRGYTGKAHYTAAWERSAATGRVVVGKPVLRDHSMAPFNSLFAFTLGFLDIWAFSNHDLQMGSEVHRRLENSTVVQGLGQ